MNHLVNFTPHWCCEDDFYDLDWGCGWRSLQTILTQIGINKDVWTLAFEVKDFTQDDELLIDFDNQVISMADMSLIISYFVDQAKSIGMAEQNADFDLLMISKPTDFNKIMDKLNDHFNVKKSKTLVMIATGGNIGLIAGYKLDTYGANMIFLFDPHSKNRSQAKIGVGGIGWVSLSDTILSGQKEMGRSVVDFLELNPPTFGFVNGVVTLSDLEDDPVEAPIPTYSKSEIDKDISNMKPEDILTFLKSDNLESAIKHLPQYQWLIYIDEKYFNELKMNIATKLKQKFIKPNPLPETDAKNTPTVNPDTKIISGKSASEELFQKIMSQYGDKLNDKEVKFFNNLIVEFNPDDENPELTKKEKLEFWSQMDDKVYRDQITAHYQSIAEKMITTKNTTN
jgi:hypothetical protein